MCCLRHFGMRLVLDLANRLLNLLSWSHHFRHLKLVALHCSQLSIDIGAHLRFVNTLVVVLKSDCGLDLVLVNYCDFLDGRRFESRGTRWRATGTLVEVVQLLVVRRALWKLVQFETVFGLVIEQGHTVLVEERRNWESTDNSSRSIYTIQLLLLLLLIGCQTIWIVEIKVRLITLLVLLDYWLTIIVVQCECALAHWGHRLRHLVESWGLWEERSLLLLRIILWLRLLAW